MKRLDVCGANYLRLVKYLASSGSDALPTTGEVKRISKWLCLRPRHIMAHRDVAALLLSFALQYERDARKAKPKP